MRREIFQTRHYPLNRLLKRKQREKAIRFSNPEGFADPFSKSGGCWEIRMARIRDHPYRFLFRYNLPFDLFEKIVARPWVNAARFIGPESVIQPRAGASQKWLFEQQFLNRGYCRQEEREAAARLLRNQVVPDRTLISDQLA